MASYSAGDMLRQRIAQRRANQIVGVHVVCAVVIGLIVFALSI
jgi:hypothetical protein